MDASSFIPTIGADMVVGTYRGDFETSLVVEAASDGAEDRYSVTTQGQTFRMTGHAIFTILYHQNWVRL